MTSAQAAVGSISTQVSGSGTLVNVEEDTLTVPANVQIKEILVSANETFSEGDMLARVETGLSDGLHTEILSGLSEGETIWYAYYDALPGSDTTTGR